MKIKAYFFFSILFFTAVNGTVFAQKNQNNKSNNVLYLPDRLEDKRHSIDSLYDVTLNGCRQKILVQSNNTDNPVLLYLHGGPGSSIMMRTHVFSDRLKDQFIFVNWDQRGTALSYHEGMDTTKISEDQLRDDAIELIKYLQNKFNHKKVYLIGHSFGSVLGLQLVADHPEYFAAYIGV
ncbi:MAG: alpha/beta hydrolase, partial [Bacteroidales bacterium]|nr:alpha/beta hydrolase [Bacteroidales bacterium]